MTYAEVTRDTITYNRGRPLSLALANVGLSHKEWIFEW
ncbi:unnamed protein product [Acidithrix sp. C25]|nr:unnamed protein product [Acidithrix sp. C25]